MDCRHILAIVSLFLFSFSSSNGQDTESTESPEATTTPVLELPAEESPPAVSAEGDIVREIQGEPIQRGPIHEAFADPLQLTPQPAPAQERAPPPPIEELPPEKSPDAKNLEWIPGYWAWDQQRDGYVWVSGVWRKIPRGRTWVAGKWVQTDDGHRWVPGTWLQVGQTAEEQEVLPTPPDSLEEGATSPAPSDDHFWIPGSWKQDAAGEYVWRPGFWSKSYVNWVWVPEHYTWRPTGCVYVPGYWDYTWNARGTLYAPCTFSSADLSGNVCYRPSRVLASSQWLADLWVGPGRYDYYYGNYNDCLQLGYLPWYRHYGNYSRYYDPFYSYYRWRFPSLHGFSLYGYLHNLHSHGHHRSTSSISFHTTKDWHRHRQTRDSLYGDVNAFSRRHGIANRSQSAAGRLRGNVGRDGSRAIGSRDGSRPLGRGDFPIRQRNESVRTGAGLANGVRSNRGPGTTRADIGTSRAPGISRSELGRGSFDFRQLRQDLDRATARNRDRARSTTTTRSQPPGNRSSIRPGSSPFPGRNTASNSARNRPGTESTRSAPSATRSQTFSDFARRANRSNPINRSTPTVTRRATPPTTRTIPHMNRGTPRGNRSAPPVTRSAPNITRSPQPRPAARSVSPRPSVSRSAPRPRPNISRPAPSPRSTPRISTPRPAPKPSRGFSTHGMKKARGADLSRQRAAMQRHINNRKK